MGPNRVLRRERKAFYRPHLTMLLLGLLVTLLVACASSAGTPSTQSDTPSAVATPTPSPTPAGPPKQSVSFTTSDHLKLAGWLWDGGGGTVLICSHETRGGKSNWTVPAATLAAHGYKVLAFDFRGYGDSDGFQDRAKMDQDMLAAIAYIRSHGAKKIILIGASLGGVISMMVTARTHINGVITLSGGYYREQTPPTLTVQEVRAITVPKLIIASKDDPYANESNLVYNDAVEPKELHIYAGMAHGTSIFDSPNGPDLYARIVAFAQKISA